MTHSARLVAITVAVIAVCSGCGDDGVDRIPAIELRPIESYASPLWTGTLTPDDPVVAEVEGAPITMSMLRQQLERAGEGADPRQVLERMIEFELLARAAFEAGKYEEAIVGDAMRKALATTWIDSNFETGLTHDDIPRKYLELAYEHARHKFDHFHWFMVADIQLLCCKTDNRDACFMERFDDVDERHAHLKTCFEYHEPEIQKMYAQVRGANTLAEFEELHQVAAMDIPMPELRDQYGALALLHKYEMQYDVDRSHEDQFSGKITYRVFYKEISDGVRNAWLANDMQVPFMTAPIRSPLGYHLLFVDEVVPEKHWPLDHPDVMPEVKRHAFTPWRQVHFAESLERMCAEVGCEIQHQRLVPLQELEEN